MTENRIKAALAGPNSSPAPIIEYMYENGEGEAQGQVLEIAAEEEQSAVFGADEVRIQVSADALYWIGESPALDEEEGKADILFAGIVYHEIVNPAHKIAFASADGVTEGKLFIRPVKRLTE